MDKLIALTVPGYGSVDAPEGVPSGISLLDLVKFSISMAMVIGIILSLIYLIYGGLFWLQASGDKTKLDKARRIIIYAIVGLIIMSLSLVIVNLVTSALGVDSLIGGGS